MCSFPLKTSSNFHCLFLNFHTQSLAFCSVPSVVFREGTGCLQLIPWTSVLTWNWWRVHLLNLWFLRSWSFLPFFVLSVWSTRLLPTRPLPPRGCRAVGQCPASHDIRIHPWPQCRLGPGPLLQQELHKSVQQIRLLVPTSTNLWSATFKSLTFSFHPHMETTE